MSGHSKWATTKHKKAVIDARRGKMFAKLIKNIEVAARMGGGDPAGNPTLYDAIQKAKKSSVPNDNIDRAVKRGSGAETGGADYQTITYEGYGPAGVAMLIECLTDNRNRAAMEVRTAMTRNGGSLADPGSVSFLFNRKGVVIVPVAQDGKTITEDDILEATLDAGADDVNDLGESLRGRLRADRPGRRALRAAGGRHRLRLGRGVVRPRHAGRAGPGRRGQDVPAGRRARGPRRRTEHLRQLRRVRRGHGGAGRAVLRRSRASGGAVDGLSDASGVQRARSSGNAPDSGGPRHRTACPRAEGPGRRRPVQLAPRVGCGAGDHPGHGPVVAAAEDLDVGDPVGHEVIGDRAGQRRTDRRGAGARSATTIAISATARRPAAGPRGRGRPAPVEERRAPPRRASRSGSSAAEQPEARVSRRRR